MFNSRLHNKQNTEQTVDKHALIFGLISVFLCGIGFSIIMPVVPFLVHPYTSSPGEQATVVTLLTSVYAFCVFFAAPVLGTLSDKYGRRPLLLVCLLGSAIGYFIFGIGGALWVLFAGRILEGITGGSIGTIFAYFADIIPPEERTKYFGWVSAVVGVGTVIGPTLGGLLAKFGYSVPMYFGALITLLNVGYGIFFMPESLAKKNILKEITFIRLNPFSQLANLLSMKNLNRLLVSAFLIWIPNGSLQAQGGSQSIQALAKMIGPIIGGQIYVSLGSAAPAFMGMILIAAAIPVLYKRTHVNM